MSEEKQIAKAETNRGVVTHFDNKKVELLRDTICKGATENEFELFLHACQRTGLDPFMKQIHPVKRWDSNLKREAMTIQTGIDGYRLIADRTGRYTPGKESTYEYKADGTLLSATSYVKKMTNDGVWHEISATAFFEEYCQRTKDGKPMAMWGRMPHVMLAKVAESAALRKAFPADLSGIYTAEEMAQADVEIKEVMDKSPITKEQYDVLNDLIGEDIAFRDMIVKSLKEKFQVQNLETLPSHLYTRLYNAAKANFERKMKELEKTNDKEKDVDTD